MATRIWQERIYDYLTSLGAKEISSRTNKYKVLFNPAVTRYYFLGSAGSVRVASNNKLTDALSYTELYHKRVELWEKKNELKTQA